MPEAAQTILAIRARATGLPTTDAMMAALMERVPDPSVFDAHPPTFMRAIASNKNLDAYYTRMAPSSLRNYAADAIDGVSFLNSHNMRSLGFGQSFDGRYVAGANERTEVDLYVQAGLKLGETANDDFIAAVRGGTIKDVSISFMTGSYRCGICDARMQQFFGMAIPTCGHWPGDEYPVSEKDPSKGMRTAFAWVDDAHMSEVSAVGDGATPGAQITEVRARQLLADGRGSPDVLAALESRYRPARSFAGADLSPTPAKEAASMEPLTPEEMATIRLALTEAGAAPDAAVPATVRAVVDELKTARAAVVEVERLKPIAEEVERLRPLADLGRQYHADEVTRALMEGGRAMGEGFATETYRGLLEKAPLEMVQQMANDWKATGDKQFPGGRLTKDGDEPTSIVDRLATPSAAYAG